MKNKKVSVIVYEGQNLIMARETQFYIQLKINNREYVQGEGMTILPTKVIFRSARGGFQSYMVEMEGKIINESQMENEESKK